MQKKNQERVSPRLGTKLTDAQKNNLIEGRKKAKEERAEAQQFFERFGELVITEKFWRSVPEKLRQDVSTAIRKVTIKQLEEDIESLEKIISDKKAAIAALN